VDKVQAVGCECGWASGIVKRFSMRPSIWRRHARASGVRKSDVVAAEAEHCADIFNGRAD
jgi:hypothetical protein